MKSESSRLAEGKSKGKVKNKTGKGLGKRKVKEKWRNGKEGVREERKKRQTQLIPFLLKT